MAQSKQESVLDEAKSLLVQGKRFMALEDFQSATDCLEQSCQLFDAYYGVAKRECADAYLEYGLALVALANQEAGSGTDKLMKKAGVEGEEGDDEAEDEEEEEGEVEGDDEEEEREDENENEKTQATENSDAKKTDEHKVEENGKEANGEVPMETGTTHDSTTNGVSTEADKPLTTTSTAAASSGASDSEPVAGTSTGNKTEPNNGDNNSDDAENEEATTIEIAWEVLCLAKRLYMTDESLDSRMKLAETLQKIGEISIEWDNNDNAVSILEECLNIRKAILPPEDRLIALTYYHLGLAHSFKSEIAVANENFQNAIDVIEKRIEMLNKDLDKAKESQDTAAVSAYQKEINELKELLPDMTMRLDDTKEDAAKSTEALKRTREEMQQEDEEVKKVCLDTSKPVDDISHLVKRKTS